MTPEAVNPPAHTPGPWLSDGRLPGSDQFGIFAQEGVACVALVQPGCLPAAGREDAARANALLIAASPDYAAVAPDAADLLEQYADFIRHSVKADDLEAHPYLPEIDRVVEDLRAAISKATVHPDRTGGGE